MEWAYIFAGLVVGLVIGLTGVGGGALMTPILIVGFGIPPFVAVSTDLLYAAVTKCGGIVTYARNRLVEWRIVRLMLLGSVPGALITVEVLRQIDDMSRIEHIMNLTLGVSLLLTSIAVFMRSRIQAYIAGHCETRVGLWMIRWRPVITSLTGLVLGVLVTLSSVGAGAVGTALLLALYPRLSMRQIVGTDLVHAVVLTTIAGIGHIQLGGFNPSLLMFLLIGSLPGVFVGSHLGVRLSPAFMRPIMGSLLMVIGLKFVLAA